MLILTVALALAAPVDDALVDCREQATATRANGVEQVVGALYTSCLQAEGLVPVSSRVNPWVPLAESCPADVDLFAQTAAEQADGCRRDAVYLDASGMARVHGGEVRSCMADAGFAQVRPAVARSWFEGCETPNVMAVAEQ